MDKETKAELQRDFLEIENAVKSRMSFLSTLDFSEEENKSRKQELEIILKKINKVRYHRLKPLKSIDTVSGIKFKIGDKFHIPGDELTTYTIVLFPDSVTIRGESSNPAIGKPWTVEVYVESARKVKATKKAKRVKSEKKFKKIKVKEGDYFTTVTNNTIYKAIEVTKKTIIGENKLTMAPNRIKTNRKKTEIILKTKKDYKKQHKAEKNYKNK